MKSLPPKIVPATQKFVVEIVEVHGLTLKQRLKLIFGYNLRVAGRLFCPHNPGPDTSAAFYVTLTEDLAKKTVAEELSQEEAK